MALSCVAMLTGVFLKHEFSIQVCQELISKSLGNDWQGVFDKVFLLAKAQQ